MDVTYSSALTIVPTYECFNRCDYCNFRLEPGSEAGARSRLTIAAAREQLHRAQAGIIEILVLSGEVHPASAQRPAWFEHIYQLCELALSLGFLPHTNAGPLSWQEFERMKAVNVSMGLMVEQLTPELLQTVHRHSPSKDPALRLQQLDWAGALRIPFTTGLLLGIGEDLADRQASLRAIATIQRQWGHIQEVILQPYRLGAQQPGTPPGLSDDELVEAVGLARSILPESIAIQVPPNLIDQPELLRRCLAAGARDLGGIGPKDEVNPSYDHPDPGAIAARLSPDWRLRLRLPVYPQYDDWLAPDLGQAVAVHRSRLAQEG
jgi:7,8-didemethyl-8-hydroxy-5-deazariboflavin synthase